MQVIGEENKMKVYPNAKNIEMTENLNRALSDYRNWRDFSPNEYIKDKVKKINDYFDNCGLDSAVVAVSGGIDSALVLSLVKKAQEISGSPIKNIYPVLLPSSVGVSFQGEATERGREVCEALGLNAIVVEMSPIVESIRQGLESQSPIKTDDWAVGQLVSYARTPVLYYMTSLISANNGSGILCGTTNMDEGSYLGYVGKASDGMVDVQLISDLHKSEVYKVSQALSIPDSIMSTKPSGDMYDSRFDEDVFGAPYDFVELYLYYLSMGKNEQKIWENFYLKNNEDRFSFDSFKDNLDKLHAHNAHKYKVGSPAFYLDLENLIYFNKKELGWGIVLDDE